MLLTPTLAAHIACLSPAMSKSDAFLLSMWLCWPQPTGPLGTSVLCLQSVVSSLIVYLTSDLVVAGRGCIAQPSILHTDSSLTYTHTQLLSSLQTFVISSHSPTPLQSVYTVGDTSVPVSDLSNDLTSPSLHLFIFIPFSKNFRLILAWLHPDST